MRAYWSEQNHGASRFGGFAPVIAAATIFPFAYIGIGILHHCDILGRQLPLLVLAVGLCSLVIWRHRENIRRLRAGTENKIRSRSGTAQVEA